MATGTPKRNSGSKADLRDRDSNGGNPSDWNVFHSMREFWFWVAIVTLLIFCIMALSMVAIHTNKQLKEVKALVVRLEEKEKKREKTRRDPIDPE